MIRAFAALFAILNPATVLPFFLALTKDLDAAESRALVLKVALYASVMCAAVVVTGSALLSFFGITIDQFRVAGGAVLFAIGWQMLNGDQSSSHAGTDDEQDHAAFVQQVAFYPMTFPMIVGPGTISTIVVFSAQAGSIGSELGVAAAVAAVLAILFAGLWMAPMLDKVLTQTAKAVTTRLMGMILLAIAVEMVAAGLLAVLPGLAGPGGAT